MMAAAPLAAMAELSSIIELTFSKFLAPVVTFQGIFGKSIAPEKWSG
jgi:hypothetical protein